ncbi:MAG: transporter substrate-binding domain-containing protein [Propionibacteriaceae bacterium]|jgi:polar amino acid transport system substrate-binding protein|nr:transporter substrate-binding domain-containing protein [Propionibacteriaceae bacterium]
MKLMKIIAGVAGAALLLAGCAGTKDEADNPYKLVAVGKLTVCSDVPYAPFEFEDPSAPSGYSGFDIEIMGEIAKRLELELVVVASNFDALQSGAALAAGQCDVGASAITITEERKANIDYTAPYYDSLQSLLVRADSGISSLADTGGKKIGVQKGTTGEIFAQENAPANAELVSFDDDGLMWLALQAGNVDALLQDQPINYEHVVVDADYVIVEEWQTDEQYGFALEKGKSPELLAAIDGLLLEMRADGAYDALYAKYFG